MDNMDDATRQALVRALLETARAPGMQADWFHSPYPESLDNLGQILSEDMAYRNWQQGQTSPGPGPTRVAGAGLDAERALAEIDARLEAAGRKRQDEEVARARYRKPSR
jgi:hypothetical protein